MGPLVNVAGGSIVFHHNLTSLILFIPLPSASSRPATLGLSP